MPAIHKRVSFVAVRPVDCGLPPDPCASILVAVHDDKDRDRIRAGSTPAATWAFVQVGAQNWTTRPDQGPMRATGIWKSAGRTRGVGARDMEGAAGDLFDRFARSSRAQEESEGMCEMSMKPRLAKLLGASSVAVLVLVGLTAAPVQAATAPPAPPVGAAPQIAATPGGTPVAPVIQHVDAAQLSEFSQRLVDCQQKAAQARAAGATAKTLCASLDPDPAPKALTKDQQLSIAAVLPECSQSAPADTGWWASGRRYACTHTSYNLVVTEVPSGVIVGTANIHAIIDMTSATSGASWTSTIYQWVWNATGEGMPTWSTGNLFGCAGCVGTSGFSSIAFDTWSGSGAFTNSLLAPGQIQNGLGGQWQIELGSPAWSNEFVTVSLGLASYRCDNAIGNRLPGCVFPGIPGVAGFSQTQNQQFVAHVYGAQVSGLPGQYTSGTYLFKLDNAALVTLNGNTACPSSLARPTGYQCDEYPFRSTYNGAYTSGATQARSQPWCQMPDPALTGPSGWSRCFIPSSQNLSAGGILGAFYSNERILDTDPFQVGYLP
jgi:hypothetical protein